MVELLDAQFGALGLVEVLVDDRRLRFAEADEVDDVGEDLDEPLPRRFVQVLEGEVVNPTLGFRENPS